MYLFGFSLLCVNNAAIISPMGFTKKSAKSSFGTQVNYGSVKGLLVATVSILSFVSWAACVQIVDACFPIRFRSCSFLFTYTGPPRPCVKFVLLLPISCRSAFYVMTSQLLALFSSDQIIFIWES